LNSRSASFWECSGTGTIKFQFPSRKAGVAALFRRLASNGSSQSAPEYL
jgi:hypothetical protein